MIEKLKVGSKITCVVKFDLGFFSLPAGKRYLITEVRDGEITIKTGRKDGRNTNLLIFSEELGKYFSACPRPIKNVRVI